MPRLEARGEGDHTVSYCMSCTGYCFSNTEWSSITSGYRAGMRQLSLLELKYVSLLYRHG